MESDEKDSLQLRKLALEIAEMERPWWKRPTYVLAALPTLLAVIALSVGFLNGFFSAQLTKLDNQKHDLEAQVREFQDKRDDLHRQKDELAKENQALKEEQTTLSANLAEQKSVIRAFKAVAPFVDQRRMKRYINKLSKAALRKQRFSQLATHY